LLRGEVAALGRQLVELRGGVAERAERQAADLATVGRRVDTTEARLAGLQGLVSGLEISVAGVAAQVARLEAVPPRLPEAAAPGASQGSRGLALPAEALFERAMESFRGGEMGQAVLDLEELVARYPGHTLVPGAHFWIAEAYFRAREYAQAAAGYQRVVEAPPGDKTAEALLKLGLTHRAMRREDRAREVWAQLLREYPDSTAAHQAQAVLRDPSRDPSRLPGVPVPNPGR
jgi:tol-pal system protein YbgF